MEKYEDGERGGGEMGSEGGVMDLNFGPPAPPFPILSDSPQVAADINQSSPSSLPAPERRSEKEVAGKEKAVTGQELAEVSKLPAGEAIGWKDQKKGRKARERESEWNWR